MKKSVLVFRVAESDKERIRQRAESMGMTMTAYMIACERKAGKSLVSQFSVNDDSSVEGE